MAETERFSFSEMDHPLGAASNLPVLPLTLAFRDRSLEVSGLLDTGSTVNVMPYDIGLRLGAIWEQQQTSVHLTGNLAQVDARVLIVSANVGHFAPVRLVFAWTQSNNTPLILGQVNFFMEFDVCFYRSRLIFDMHPKRDHR